MQTIKQIKAKLKDLSDGHLQINSFRWYTDPPEEGILNQEKFVTMLAVLQPGNLTPRVNANKIKLVIADLVSADQSDLDDIISDTELIILDIMAQFWDWCDDNRIGLVMSTPKEHFVDASQHCYAGWQIDLVINQFYSRDTCQVPGVTSYLTLENEDYLLLENGDKIII